MELKIISFYEILEIWKYKLWPNRKSEIKPMSSMTFFGDYDMTIYDKYKPTFFGVFHEKKLIGVNSGHRTSENMYRSRGIWVDEQYRNNKISKILFEYIDKISIEEKCDVVWSIPRLTALPAYESSGFFKCSEPFDVGMEFGPNCYVIKRLR